MFGTIGLDSRATDGTQTIKGNTSIDLGATYKMDGMTMFGKYLSTKATLSGTTGGALDSEGKTTAYAVGAGWKKEMTKSTNMYARVEVDATKTENSSANLNFLFPSLNKNFWNLPLVLAAESQALSWLAIRGSIAHSLLGADLKNRADLSGMTTVSAGVGMTFGDVSIDGMVASDGGNINAIDNIGFGNGVNSGANFGFGDKMISRIGLTYNF